MKSCSLPWAHPCPGALPHLLQSATDGRVTGNWRRRTPVHNHGHGWRPLGRLPASCAADGPAGSGVGIPSSRGGKPVAMFRMETRADGLSTEPGDAHDHLGRPVASGLHDSAENLAEFIKGPISGGRDAGRARSENFYETTPGIRPPRCGAATSGMDPAPHASGRTEIWRNG